MKIISIWNKPATRYDQALKRRVSVSVPQGSVMAMCIENGKTKHLIIKRPANTGA